VDGYIRWSFANRGDLDGQWQMVRTFNPANWTFLERVTPEPIPYYSYGILTRFLAMHSSVLEIRGGDSRAVAAAVRSPKGNLTIYVLNKSDKAEPVVLRITDLTGHPSLHKYQVTEATTGKADYTMAPLEAYPIQNAQGTISESLPPRSISAYTTYCLNPNDPGVTAD